MSAADPSVRASDPHISAWVAANAGSGKTHTLANRVARLLLSGAWPGRILCLTFTKAAAAEMQGRLFSQLGRWSMLPDAELETEITAIGAEADDLPKARRLFAQALETPGGLKVLTIHAFCQIVLSRFPIEAGVPPGFTVLDENSSRGLIAEARQGVLTRAGNGDKRLQDAIGLLVGESGEEALTRILAAALGNDRRKMDRFFAVHESFEEAVWRAHGVARDEDIAGDFCAGLKRDIAILKESHDWLNTGTSGDTENGDKLAAFLALDFSPESFRILGSYLLKKDGDPRTKLATAALARKRPDLLAYLTQLQQRFGHAENRQRAARAAALAEAALTLINTVRHAYAAAKKRRGTLDYDDLIVKTLELLEKRQAAPWVLFKLDGGLDHILIDEAQDTSPEQWAIIRALTEEFFSREARSGATGVPRTLFAVGDEKQSIFSFQGADPAQFDINRRHFQIQLERAELPFAEQPLTISRRSAPHILQYVDTLFAGPDARAGLTSRGEAITHQAHRDQAQGGVEFWEVLLPADAAEMDYYRPVDVEQKSSPIVRLAMRLADEIHRWIGQGLALPGHDAPIRPGDIMILLPRREPFGGEVIRQLKLRKIPVAGADRIVLTEQIAVMDLVALGRFVLQRDDELNLASLLRSPLCGIGEEELFALCHGRSGGLWSALAAARGAPFEAAHIFLSEMLERADYAPPFEFFSHALTHLGKRRAMIARLGPEAGDAIEEFLSLSLDYEHDQTPSLEGFLDWIMRGGNEIKRDMERGRNEVRVMTVHGAKGLEADIVILPDTTGLPEMPWKKGHLLYTEDGVLFPLAHDEAPEVVKQAKRQVEEEILKEHRRLLYVALTRARDRLYVCGFQNRLAPRDRTWYRLAEAAAHELGTSLTRGETALKAFGETGHAPGLKDADALAAAPSLPGWTLRPAPRETAGPRLIRPSDAGEALEGPVLSPLEGARRFRRGQVVHTLLARLPDLPREARRAAAIAFARRNGFDESLAEESLAVIDHPDFAAAFGPGSQAEVAFQAALPAFGEEAQIAGRIDRLAVTADQVLILDYKTNRPPPADEEDVDPVYLAQMALYRDGAARIFPGRRIVCGLIWTDGPRLVRLSDRLLDRQIAALSARLAPPTLTLE
ncbi:MAG TPA: double-strand break repair helicase AddA [Rhizomicrobium sp.]|nr:double-strand break repair helicase AddA [Rhizomicrobium sp.]